MRELRTRRGSGTRGAAVPPRGAVLLATLLALFTVTCRETPTVEPAPPKEGLELIERAMASGGAEEDLLYLCGRFGGRVTGSEGCDEAGKWLRRRLLDAGLDSVGSEPFPLADPWMPIREAAECTEPGAFPIRVAAVPGSPATPLPEVPLRVAPLAGRDVDPSTAVALHPTPQLSSAGHVDAGTLRDAISRAASMGFRALLIQSALEGRVLYRKLVSPSGVLPLPVAFVAREDFERLSRTSARAPTRVRLRIELSKAKAADGVNLVGEIRGTEAPDEIVLLGAHYDSWDLGTGAQDNAVNVALLLEVARQLRALGLEPRRTLRFVLFSGEEQDRQGSAAYVRRHEAELDRHVLALFFDLGGGAINGFYFNERRELAPVFKELLFPFPGFRRWAPLNLVYSGTDNLDFLLEGVPNVVAATDLTHYGPTYHSELDLPGTVDPMTLRKNVAFAATVAWQLANRAERPARRQGAAETRKLVERFGVRKEIEGTWRWDRLLQR